MPAKDGEHESFSNFFNSPVNLRITNKNFNYYS